MSSESLLIGLGAVAGFAAGQACSKFLGKPDASSHSPTVAPTVNNTVNNADSSSNPSATTTAWSDDKIKNFIDTQKSIIKFVHPDQKSLSAEEKLLARAMPNQGLKHTFGAHNAFTANELSIADPFKAEAKRKLQTALGLTFNDYKKRDGHWKPLVGYMRSTLENELSRSDEVVNLAELIQFLTLKVSLQYLFGERPGLENREAVKYVAKTINILWIRSKAFRTNADFTAMAGQMWDHEYRLRDHLRTITGANSSKPMDNPLNFILPAYETMWRAVSKGVLEVYFRNAPDANKWKQLLSSFLHNPTRKEFKYGDKSQDLSPLDVMKEVFRIYPPTRHVYRQFPNDPLGKFDKADIETCHRLRFLAQNNPEWFRPERWLEIKRRYVEDEKEKAEANEKQDKNNEQQTGAQTPQAGEEATRTLKVFEEELGFMPFAIHCPAGKEFTQGFGFKLAALLIASISEAFDKLNEKDTWKLEAESPNDVLPALGKALRPNREDYLSLVYRKVIDGSGDFGETTRQDAGQSDQQEEHIDQHGEQNDQVGEQKNDNARAS